MIARTPSQGSHAPSLDGGGYNPDLDPDSAGEQGDLDEDIGVLERGSPTGSKQRPPGGGSKEKTRTLKMTRSTGMIRKKTSGISMGSQERSQDGLVGSDQDSHEQQLHPNFTRGPGEPNRRILRVSSGGSALGGGSVESTTQDVTVSGSQDVRASGSQDSHLTLSPMEQGLNQIDEVLAGLAAEQQGLSLTTQLQSPLDSDDGAGWRRETNPSSPSDVAEDFRFLMALRKQVQVQQPEATSAGGNLLDSGVRERVGLNDVGPSAMALSCLPVESAAAGVVNNGNGKNGNGNPGNNPGAAASSSQQHNNDANAGSYTTTCAICLDKFDPKRCVTPCGHEFCSECLCEMLTSRPPRDLGHCPLCREFLTLVSLRDAVSGRPLVMDRELFPVGGCGTGPGGKAAE